MNKLLYIFLFASLFFVACSSEDVPNNPQKNDKQIELRLNVKNFVGETKTKAGFDDDDEKKIDRLYLFISTGSNWHKYNISSSTFDGGTWEKANDKILLALTGEEVGQADVYVVANANLNISAINSLNDLKNAMVTNDAPWTDIATPLIMSGSASQNFATNPILNAVSLTRAVAKAEVTVTLTQQYQSEDIDEYAYRLLNFNKNTYLFGDAPSEDLEGTDDEWIAIADPIEIVEEGGIITGFTFTTYLNERANATEGHTTLELKLPFWDDGAPPPQFLDESLPIQFPATIERNHYYKIAVTM